MRKLRRKDRPKPTGWRRVWRWTLRSSELIVLLVIGALALITVLLANLDRPSVSRSLLNYLEEEVGLSVSFDALHAKMLSMIVGREVKIASPVAFRTFAPDFVRLGALDAKWNPQTLLSDHLEIDHLEINGLKVAIVADETGRTSLDLLFPDSPPEGPTPAPPGTLSSSLEAIPDNLKIGRVRVSDVVFEWIEIEENAIRRVVRVEGLELIGSAAPGDDEEAGIHLELRSPEEQGFRLTILETNMWSTKKSVEKTAVLDIDLKLHMNKNKLEINLEISLEQQDIVDLALPPGGRIVLESQIRFRPEKGRTEIVVSRLNVLDSAILGEASVHLLDMAEGAFQVLFPEADIQVDLSPLLPLIPIPESLEVKGGRVALKVEDVGLDPEFFMPVSGTLELVADLKPLRYEDGSVSAAISGVRPKVSARFLGAWTQSLTATIPVAEVVYQDPVTQARLSDVTATFVADTLELDPEDLLSSTGGLDFSVQLGGGAVELGRTRLSEAVLELELGTRLSGAPPYVLDAGLRVVSLKLTDPSAGSYNLAGASVACVVKDLDLDLEHPEESDGRLELNASVGPLRLQTTARKSGETVAYRLDAGADHFASLAPLLNTLLGPEESVSWHRLGLTLASTGTVRGLTGGGVTRIDQRAKLVASNLAYRTQSLSFATPSIRGSVDYHGSTEVGDVDLDLTLNGWTYDAMGSSAPTRARLKVGLDLPADRYEVNGSVTADDFFYQEEALRVAVTGVALKAEELSYQADTLNGAVDLKLDQLEYLNEGDWVALSGLVQHLDLATRGTLSGGELLLHYRADSEALEQNFTGMYPPADLRLETTIRLARLSAIAVDQLVLESVAGQTHLELSGAMDDAEGSLAVIQWGGLAGEGSQGLTGGPITGGESLTFDGVLSQRLEALSGEPKTLTGRGEIVVPFLIESPDQVLYRIASTIAVNDVDLELPGVDVAIKGWSGRFQVIEEVQDTGDGFRIMPVASRNAYARASFPDTHPFLTGDSYFSMDSVRYSDFDVAPLAGNLRVDRNMLRLDQLQAGVKQGTVTGQMLVDYQEDDALILFRGNAAGLRLVEDADERLDANLALEFSLRKLDLAGQAHIVRVGRKTLLSMLDLVDPYREDPDINTVRLALKAGYPKFARLRFEHGFMAVKIALGGAAQAVKIDEIRGIAIGPVLNNYLGDLL